MTDAEVDTFLAGRHTMNIATKYADGRIHLVAMWYGFLDGNVAFATFAKSQKVLNLRRDPAITALVEDGDHYDQLMGVELIGQAELVEDDDRILQCGMSVARRYWGPETDEAATEIAAVLMRKRVVVVIHPDKVVSWDHRKLHGAY